MLFLIWINSGIDICKMNFDRILKSRVGIQGEGNNEIKAVNHETCVVQLHVKENDFKKGGRIRRWLLSALIQLMFEDRVLGCNLLFLWLLIPCCAEFCQFCHSPIPTPSLLKYQSYWASSMWCFPWQCQNHSVLVPLGYFLYLTGQENEGEKVISKNKNWQIVLDLWTLENSGIMFGKVSRFRFGYLW